MTIRPRPSFLSALLTTASLAVAGLSACGKDKPAEEAEPAKVEAEEPKEGEAGGGEKGDTAEADASDKAPSAEADAGATDPKSRRPARDRLNNRRPPPVRPGADLRRHNGDRPGEAGEPGEPGAEPGVGDPGATPGPSDPMAAPPAPDPANPGGSPQPALAQPEPTPTPSEPTPVPTPVEPALAQPEPTPAPTPEPRPHVAAHAGGPQAETLLPLQVALELLGNPKLAPAGALPGIAVQPGYSSVLYAAPEATKLGVSLQVWQDPARRESDDRFRRMRLQYPKAEDITALPPAKAFFAHFSGVQILTFVDSVKRVVASVACGEGVCTHDQLVKLAKAVRERL